MAAPFTANVKYRPMVDGSGVSLMQSGLEVSGPDPVWPLVSSTMSKPPQLLLSNDQWRGLLPDNVPTTNFNFDSATIEPSADGELHLVVEGYIPQSVLDAFDIRNGALVAKSSGG